MKWKYKSILIITDNIQLSEKFESIIGGIKGVEYSFGISPFSSLIGFREKLESPVNEYDLNDLEVINSIIRLHDLVISIHCKQFFPKTLVESIKCINIHPGYNPINRGWFPQVFSIIYDLPIGATIHEIDNELDHGAIIAREFVDKTIGDTSLSLYNKILRLEVKLLKENIEQILLDSYKTIVPEGEGNLFMKKDFNDLCQLDLEESLTMREALNRLRALSHGDYSNAYFIDEVSRQKYYCKIIIESYE